MAENIQNQFKCSGDCLNCRAVNDRKIQWQYCAAQFSYNTLRTIQTIQESVNVMAGEVKELKDKIEAIQNSEATVFDANTETLIPKTISGSENTAQEGAGAIVEPQNSNI